MYLAVKIIKSLLIREQNAKNAAKNTERHMNFAVYMIADTMRNAKNANVLCTENLAELLDLEPIYES